MFALVGYLPTGNILYCIIMPRFSLFLSALLVGATLSQDVTFPSCESMDIGALDECKAECDELFPENTGFEFRTQENDGETRAECKCKPGPSTVCEDAPFPTSDAGRAQSLLVPMMAMSLLWMLLSLVK